MRSTTPAADLDAERRRVDRVAVVAAAAADRHVLRLAGGILRHVADVNGADFEVERINACLRAAGHPDVVATATARLRRPIDGRLADAVAAVLIGARRG